MAVIDILAAAGAGDAVPGGVEAPVFHLRGASTSYLFRSPGTGTSNTFTSGRRSSWATGPSTAWRRWR